MVGLLLPAQAVVSAVHEPNVRSLQLLVPHPPAFPAKPFLGAFDAFEAALNKAEAEIAGEIERLEAQMEQAMAVYQTRLANLHAANKDAADLFTRLEVPFTSGGQQAIRIGRRTTRLGVREGSVALTRWRA